MRFSIYITVLFILTLTSNLSAQKRKGKIDFKTEGIIDCQVYRDLPDELSKQYVSFFGASDHTGFSFGFAYEKYNRSLYYGVSGCGFLGSFGAFLSAAYFPIVKEKPAKLRVSADYFVGVPPKNGGRPVGRFKTVKQTAFGLHSQLFYLAFPKAQGGFSVNNTEYIFTKPSYASIAIGVAYSSTKGADLKMTKYIGKSRRTLIAFDLLVTPLFFAKIHQANYPIASGNTSTATVDVTTKDIEITKVGYHAFIQQHFGGTYHFNSQPTVKAGFFWRAGIIQPPYYNTETTNVRAGATIVREVVLGIYFNFD
ncbi:MAG: hypothetical protein L6Q81_14110 [Bacteroidia bacterium]|nr:hypothetical protein [Bacteroidia bacterium]